MAQSYPTSYIDFINRANDYARQRAATTPPPVQQQTIAPSSTKQSSIKLPTTAPKTEQKQGFWDPLGSAVGDFFNKLTAGGRGVENAIDKGSQQYADQAAIDRATKKPLDPNWREKFHQQMVSGEKTYLRGGSPESIKKMGATNAATLKGFGEGFTAGWNGDYSSPNYMSGEQLIKNERARNNANPDYAWGQIAQPKENIIAPIPFLPDLKINYDADFWPGMAIDIVTDPVTWISEGTAGLGMAAARGAAAGVRGAATVAKEAGLTGAQLAGARAAGTLGGAARGTIVGAGKAAIEDAYKVGRFSKTIKPVGIKQWYEVKKFNTFDKIAQRAGMTTGDLIAVSSGKVAAKDLADSFAQKAAQIVEGGGKVSGKQLTEKSIENAAQLAKPYLSTATKFYEGALASKTGGRLAAGTVSKSLIPVGGMGEIQFGARNSETTAGSQLAERTAAAEQMLADATAAGNVPAAQRAQIELNSLGLNDSGISRPPTVQDTSPITPHALLNIHPSWDVRSQYGMGVETIQKAITEHGADSQIVQDMRNAFNDIFDVQPLKPTQQMPGDPLIPTNPTQYPTNTLADQVFGDGTSEASSSRIDELLRLNKESDVAGPQDQALFFDMLLDTVPHSEDIVARLKWALSVGPEDSVAEAIFGTQRMLHLYADESAEAWWDAIKAIADFPYEIPGYTAAARDFVKEYDRLAVEMDLKPKAPKRSGGGVDAAGNEVQSIDWNAMAQMTDMDFQSPDAMVNRLYAEYRAGIQAIGAGGEDVLGSRNGRPVHVNNAKIKGGSDVLSDADTAIQQGEFAGQYVDIFGQIVKNPEPEMKAALESVAEQAKTALKTGEMSAASREFITREKQIFSANTGGYGPGLSLSHRRPANQGTISKKDAEFLMNPGIPQELADIYDHVAGFARVPLGFQEWTDALRRIAQSAMPMRRKAAEWLKGAMPTSKNQLKGYNEYLAAFEKITPAQVKGARKSELSTDLSAGVNVFGDIFKNGDGHVADVNAGKISKAQNAAESAQAELQQAEKTKAKKLSIFTTRSSARTAQAKFADMQMEDLAVSNRAKVGERGVLADRNNPEHDPIRVRTTTGSWISPKELLKNYLQASDAAAAANFIEHAKMFRDGLRNGLRAVAPMVEWRTRNYRVFETMPLAGSAEHVIALTNSIKTHIGDLRDAIKIARSTREAVPRETPMLGGEVGVFALPETTFFKTARIGMDSLLTKEGKAYVGEIISKIIADSGVDFGIHSANAEAAILDIVNVAARDKTLWPASKWASEISKARYETGASRPALIAEVKSGILEHKLRDVGAALKDFNENGSPGFYDAEMRALVAEEKNIRNIIQRNGAMRSFLERGLKEPPSLDGLKKMLQGVTIQGGLKEYDLNSLVKLAQVIADNTGEGAKLSKALKAVDGDAAIRAMSQGQIVADYIRSRAPQIDQLLTNDMIKKASEVEAVNKFTLWDGDAIQAIAKSTDFTGVITKNRQTIDGEMSRIRTPEFAARVNMTANNAFAASIKTVEKKGDRIFDQASSRVLFSAVETGIKASGLFKLDSIESWNARLMAMRLARQIQHESGIFDGTKLTQYGGRVKPKLGQDHDFAYIGFLDVIDSMTSAIRSKNLSQDLHLALSEDAPRVIFDLLKIDGKSFPVDVAQEAAVLAMKMSTVSGMKEAERAVWLNDVIIHALKTKPGYEAWGQALDPAMKSDASRAVAMLAGSLANEKVTANLMRRHQARAALAVASATEKTARITQPIMEKLSQVADNIFANSGERAAALEASINDLRGALVQAGFAKNSLETIISMKALEKHQMRVFTPMEFSTSRHTIRLKAAFNEPTVDAKMSAVASENAHLASNVRKVADDAQQNHVAAQLQNALDSGDPEALQSVVEQSTNIAGDASETASVITEHIKNGNSPLSKRSPEEAQAGLNLDAAMAELDQIDREFLQLTYWGDPASAPPGRIEELTAMQHAQQAKVEELKAVYYGIKDGRIAAEQTPSGELAPLGAEDAAKAIEEGAGDTNPGEIAKPLSEYATQSKMGLLHQAFSAQAGKSDLVSDFGSTRQGLDTMATIAQKGMDDLWKKIRVRNDVSKRWEIPLVYNRIAAKLIYETSGSARRAFVNTLKGEEKAFAEEFQRVAGHFYDDSFIARMGLRSGHIQDFFNISHFRGHKFMNFGNKTELTGWEVADYLKQAMISTLSAPVDKGGMDWYQLFRTYNYVNQKAMQAPELMANFTARFGHIADGYATIEEAMANGYVRVAGAGKKSAKGFTQFLDPKQVYPKDIIEQLANIESMYNKMIPTLPTTKAGEGWHKAIKLYDTTTTAIKKSLTTWSPANHLLNAQGELMVNFMAGVYNPSVYGRSLRILHAGGELKTTGRVNATNSVSEAAAKAPRTLEDLADAKSGVKVRVGGVTKTMSHEGAYLFLQRIGTLMTNNSMEDFIIHTSEELAPDAVQQGIKYGSPVSRAFKNTFEKTDHALANFAATRDNVFRVAHAVDIMEKGNFRSMEEMASHIQHQMNKYHPTMYGLSNFESKVLRRLAFFYSWKRGALRAVMETIMDYPIAITLPQYASFAVSGAMGGKPAGYGHPAPADPDLPGWARTNITGPTWHDQNGDVHTISFNAPSSDILSTYFGGLQYDQRLSPTQNTIDSATRLIRDNTISQTNPFISIAATGLTGVQVSDSGSYPVSDWGQYIQDQVGLGKISRATGIALINDNGILQPRTGGGSDNPERAATNQFKGIMGMLTPLRYNRPSDYSSTAKRENTTANNIAKRRYYQDPTLAWWQK